MLSWEKIAEEKVTTDNEIRCYQCKHCEFNKEQKKYIYHCETMKQVVSPKPWMRCEDEFVRI